MILCRLILADWAKLQTPSLPKVVEGQFTLDEISSYNAQGYNIYYYPNYPSLYHGGNVSGSDIDTFEYVFVDCDLKDGIYKDKDVFVDRLLSFSLKPTKIVDSGNGVHAYWQVSGLDPISYLHLQRRLCRFFETDPAVSCLLQLMRLPNTVNTKRQDNLVPCKVIEKHKVKYSAEELDNALPPLTLEDKEYCEQHYNRIHNPTLSIEGVTEDVPKKFWSLLDANQEVKRIWTEPADDRSKNDFRLGHILRASGFSKAEAMSVLINTAKALQRAPVHRLSYAENIVNKIGEFEAAIDKTAVPLSRTVAEILAAPVDAAKGTRFYCHPRIDNTEYGFRLGHVIGLVAGSGVGKTAFALNMFRWFVESNPNYHHLFVALEQPAMEIAQRWATMCGTDTTMHDKVHLIDNYDEQGGFRHLSLEDIKAHVLELQSKHNIKIGCVVIDHIGVLKRENNKDEKTALETICKEMKAFAATTNTMLVMQSQTSREKAGIGDLELNKDAAYGTVFFESYVDYLITLWQPLKRCHAETDCPTVTAFKYCKIRHKRAKVDLIQEDKAYYMYFDSLTERMEDMTQDQKISFDYWHKQAVQRRSQDRKTDVVKYDSVNYQGQQ